MDKSYPRVIEMHAPSIQLNLDRSKSLMAERNKDNTKKQNEAGTNQPTTAASGQQTKGFPGRMTASSFMNITDHQAAMVNLNAVKIPQSLINACIPRSFIRNEFPSAESHPQNIHQYYSSPQTTLNQYSADWEPPMDTTSDSQHQFGGLPSNQTWNPVQSGLTSGQGDQTFYQSDQTFSQSGQSSLCQTNNSMDQTKQQYSPSDLYSENPLESTKEDRESPESQQSGSKRLSAFKRLGPVTQPKKPKLTINLLFNKEQAVREVVDQSSDAAVDKYTPAHLKPDIQTSIDDTVMKYLVFWPWKKPFPVRRTINSRTHSKIKPPMPIDPIATEDVFDKDSAFYQVSVTGYPESWDKEDVMDAVLESVKGKSMIPCFIEITKLECKFLVIRSGAALKVIHKYGYVIRRTDVVLQLSIMMISLNVSQIDFIPRLVLRKRLSLLIDSSNTELNLKEFTTTSDVSHFIYFPLSRVENQNELVRLQATISWQCLTKLDLSHNRISNLSGFDLNRHTPRLKHLDLSYNCLTAVTALLTCRALPLQSLALEGNPLCTDYLDHERYIKVLRLMFSELREIDGIKFPLPGDMPEIKRNYCVPEAMVVVEKVLEVLFPLLDAPLDERHLCEELYDVNAVLTVTYMYKLRYGPIYKDYHTLFLHARVMDEGEMNSVNGAANIAKLVNRWPMLQHDPQSFTVDVLYHTETTTILRISGMLRVTTESLAEDEHLLAFTRTLVLNSIDTIEYKITNEMIYWDLPDKERARNSFQTNTVKNKNLSLKLNAPPDDDLKEKLLQIFMSVTDLPRKPSVRCLEAKEWNLKNALEYFCKLLKLDNLEPLND